MKVFISYTPDTEPLAERLATDLRKHDHEPLWDRAEASPGKPWLASLEEMLRTARASVFLVGAERQHRTEREWSAALDDSWSHPGKRMIPLLIKDATAPPFLRDRQAIRVRDPGQDWERSVRALVAALRGERQHGQRVAVTAALRKQQKQRIKRLEKQSKELAPSDRELQRQADALRETLAALQAANDPEAARTAARLADLMKALGKPGEAFEFLEVSLKALEPQVEANDPLLARTHANLASALLKLERPEKARDHLEQAVAIYWKQDEVSAALGASELRLAKVLKDLGEIESAEQHRQAGIDVIKEAGWKFLSRLPLARPFLRSWERASARKKAAAKPVRKKAPAMKPTPRKKAAAKPAKKRTVRKKPTRKKAASKPAKKAAAKKRPTKKKAARKKAPAKPPKKRAARRPRKAKTRVRK